jgi:putative methionine-R-sulfoxide reductase with GAF domain
MIDIKEYTNAIDKWIANLDQLVRKLFCRCQMSVEYVGFFFYCF